MAEGTPSRGGRAAERPRVRGAAPAGRGWLAGIGDALVSVFFPAGCRICDELLASASRVPICEACLASFVAVPQPACDVCGRALPGLTPEPGSVRNEGRALLCPACRDKTYAFERARSFAMYEGALVGAILLLKFEQIEPLGAWFAERLAEVVKGQGSALVADVVVPVPLHRQRERERGYNQAALLSKPLAKRLGLPHKAVLLMRTRARPEKQILTLEERWESVRGAFATRPGSQVDNLRVLLLDDVLTTGATLDACARALLEAGAKSVVGLTVARAARDPLPSSSEW
ncbi:MAG: ComF family protein [Candidatus Acidiferrum sp.]